MKKDGKDKCFMVYYFIEGIDPISFGVYYKALKGNMLLKSFMEIMKEQFKGEKGKK